MKYLVLSDLHGSKFFAEKIKKIIVKENPDNIILLGDLYYHGPRNALPKDYAPMEVCNILNTFKEKIIACKGNCDAEVDEMISEFKFNESVINKICNKSLMFTHGHKHNIENLPKDIDVLIYGHFHTGFIKQKDNVICVNAGSVSLPKENTANSYVLIEDNILYLKDLYNNVIDKITFA